MSFILDALKKSDAKRRAQLGPDLATPTALAAPSSDRLYKPIVIWGLVGLAGVLIMGAALVWFVSDRGSPLDNEAATPQVAASQADAIDETAGADPEPQPQPSQSMRSDEPIEIVEESGAMVSSEATASAPPQPSAEQIQSIADTAPTTGLPARAASVPEPDSASVEALEARLVAVSESEPQEGAAVDAEEPSEVAGAESLAEADEPQEVWQPQAADYLYQWELPLTVRQNLPALNLLVHVYSNRPDDRFVLINGTRFREGDELAPGVRLAEIRPEGALIDFRDYRFLLSQ